MPEGVECLVVADNLKQWFKDQDTEGKGYSELKLEEILDEVVLRKSPIGFKYFNENFRFVDYNKIHTFGKTIFIPNYDGKYCVAARLAMTGTFSEEPSKHSRVYFYSEYKPLYFNDIRKFGCLLFYPTYSLPRNIASMMNNAIEWRDKDAPEKFVKRVRTKYYWNHETIKTVLLNQQLISGIGNIYASECLFKSGINPKKLVKELAKEQLEFIIKNCQEIMFESYKLGGMTVKNFQSFNKKGFAQSRLNVYGKDGLSCRTCGKGIIKRIQQRGRSTFFCPICQPFNNV